MQILNVKLSLAFCIAGTALVLCQIPNVPIDPPSLTALRSEYGQLASRVFDKAEGHPKPLSVTDEGTIEEELRSIVRRGTAVLLDSARTNAQKIKEGIQTIQGSSDGLEVPPDYALPFADLFTVNATDTAAVAYPSEVLYSPPTLDFFVRTSKGWEQRASVGEEFRRCTFSVRRLPSPLAGQVWYLAWGHLIGDSGTRLKLRLYSFDGAEVRTVWSREGLTWGRVEITDGSVVLDYAEKYAPTEAGVKQIHEILHVTANGLQ